MSDPIEIVKKGQASLSVGETDGGDFRPVAVDETGNLQVEVVGGSGGTTDAHIYGKQGPDWVEVPLVVNAALASDPGVPVHVASAPTLTTQPAASFAAAATPATDANAAVVRLAGITSEAVGETSYALDVVAYEGGAWVVAQGTGGDPGKQGWIVQGTDTINAERLATYAAQTDGSQKAIARGGDKGLTAAADVTSTDQGADNTALDVQIWHGGSAKDPTDIRALTGSDIVGANLRVAAADVANGNPVPVSDAGSSLTVDGIVTANIGTTGGLALDATLTGGTQKAIVRGGAKGATAAADVTSTAQGADHQALDAQLYHNGSMVDPREIYTGSPAAIVTETNAVWVREARRPSFTAYSPATAPGNNKSMLSLAFSGTGRIVLREIFIQNVQIASVTGVALYFELHRFATHSGGTDLTANIMSHRTADILPAGTTVRTGATISGDNVNFMRRWMWSSDEVVAGATKFETIAAAFANLLGSLGYGDPLIRRPSIASGEGLHVVCTTNTTIGTFDVGFVFTQE